MRPTFNSAAYAALTYTDGTMLYLSVRECLPREKVKDLKNSYGNLIRDCARYDVWTVDGLQQIRNGKKVPA